MSITVDASKSNMPAYLEMLLSPLFKKGIRLGIEIDSLVKNRDRIYELFRTSIRNLKFDERYQFVWCEYTKIDSQRMRLEKRNQMLHNEFYRFKLGPFQPKKEFTALFESNTKALRFENFWKDDLGVTFNELNAACKKSWCIIS